MLQAKLLEKQAINGSIDDELKRLLVRLDASDTERENSECNSIKQAFPVSGWDCKISKADLEHRYELEMTALH